jgi:hypothetical protein
LHSGILFQKFTYEYEQSPAVPLKAIFSAHALPRTLEQSPGSDSE